MSKSLSNAEALPEAELDSKGVRTYVCMFELQSLNVYVCFESETSEHVCMFQGAGRVCMYVYLINTRFAKASKVY